MAFWTPHFLWLAQAENGVSRKEPWERAWAPSVCRVPGWPLGAAAAGSLLSRLALGCARGNCLQWLPLSPMVLLRSWARKKEDCNCIENLSWWKQFALQALPSEALGDTGLFGVFSLLPCSRISLGSRGQHSWRQHGLNLSPSAWKGPD